MQQIIFNIYKLIIEDTFNFIRFVNINYLVAM